MPKVKSDKKDRKGSDSKDKKEMKKREQRKPTRRPPPPSPSKKRRKRRRPRRPSPPHLVLMIQAHPQRSHQRNPSNLSLPRELGLNPTPVPRARQAAPRPRRPQRNRLFQQRRPPTPLMIAQAPTSLSRL